MTARASWWLRISCRAPRTSREVEFKNAYTVTPKDSSVTDKIKATKFLTGRDLIAGEFSFGPSRATRSSPPAPTTPSGKITMSEITYNSPASIPTRCAR